MSGAPRTYPSTWTHTIVSDDSNITTNHTLHHTRMVMHICKRYKSIHKSGRFCKKPIINVLNFNDIMKRLSSRNNNLVSQLHFDFMLFVIMRHEIHIHCIIQTTK